MADPRDLPYEGLVLWDSGQPFPDHRPPPAVHRVPWHRNPRLLIALIVTALIALVVASVLLLTRGNGDTGDSGGRFKPTIRTSGTLATPTAPTTAAPGTAEMTTDTAAETTSGEEPSPEPETTASPAESAPPSTPPQGGTPDAPDGPRINVTRNPMSFTPGQRAGR